MNHIGLLGINDRGLKGVASDTGSRMTETDDRGAAEAPAGFFYVLSEAVRILFVDDDPIMREFALVQLETDEARVAVAADGAEALKMLATEPFDIVLMDLEMPVMDGFEALRRLRADPATARLPVIMVTGREDVVAIDRAYQAGATSFLVKPINWRLLSYQVRYVMRTHRAEAKVIEAQETATEGLRTLAKSAADLLRLAIRDGAPELQQAATEYGAKFGALMERLK